MDNEKIERMEDYAVCDGTKEDLIFFVADFIHDEFLSRLSYFPGLEHMIRYAREFLEDSIISRLLVDSPTMYGWDATFLLSMVDVFTSVYDVYKVGDDRYIALDFDDVPCDIEAYEEESKYSLTAEDWSKVKEKFYEIKNRKK